jgi:excinuclease ABC subunit B
MTNAIGETDRRRAKQVAYNEAHGITPTTIQKAIRRGLEANLRARKKAREAVATTEEQFDALLLLRDLEGEMLEAAKALDFEGAARLRDQARLLRARIEEGDDSPVRRSEVEKAAAGSGGRRARKAGSPGVRPTKRRRSKRG